MYNSIQHFNEFGVKIIEKVIKDFINQGNNDIADLVIGLQKPLQELQCSLIAETIECLDEELRKSDKRKEKWSIVRSGDCNKFMATCGEIKYERTYFKSKETGKRTYLSDNMVGIETHMRISNDVVINAIENAVDTSYRASGKLATNTADVISKQAVMKQIHEVEIPKITEVKKEKKKVRVLYIDADEDHVSLQFRNKKGDLKKDNYGRKQNTIMPRLVYVYEGIRRTSPKGKRHELYGKYYFSGVYSDSEKLWDEVSEYINNNYDVNVLEKIYISGDGASWIKTGLDILGSKSRFILDKFHLNKYIIQATSHLEDTVESARQAIYDSFSFEDKEYCKQIFDDILSITDKKTKRKAVLRSRDYIMNQWNGIIIKNEDSDARIGCSAESHISHILSDRLSSRPLGWSRLGVDKMSRLRAYVANGGEIYDLVMYKKEKEKIEIEAEIKKNYDREIKKKRINYNDSFNAEIIPLQAGKTDGLRISLKALRGICG
jgi:hypothetical protein